MVTPQSVQGAILVSPTVLNFLTFGHSGLGVRVPECQNSKNGGLDQYGAKCFGILPQSENTGMEGFIFFD